MWRDWFSRWRRWEKRSTWSFEKTKPWSAGSQGIPLCLWSSKRAAASLRSRRSRSARSAWISRSWSEALLELAGEALALDAEVGEKRWASTMSKGPDWGIGGCGASEHFGFEERDAVEAPGSVREFLDELRFGGSGGLVFVEEAAAMGFEGGGVLGGEERRKRR